MKKYFFLSIGLLLSTLKTEAQTVTDLDGNIYNVVTIGSQQWTKENLKSKHYANGDPIPNVWDQNAWSVLNTGARTYWGIDSLTNEPLYGALYNCYAVQDSRNVCPSGWHVPTISEWNVMEKYLDNSVDTTLGPPSYYYGLGTLLKDTSISFWHGGEGTNTSNFSGLPGGSRWFMGMYSCLGTSGDWWTSSSFISNMDTVAWYHGVAASVDWENKDTADRRSGLSVRCISNSNANSINENLNEKHFLVYPNPASDFILINVDDSKNTKMQVYSITGECVMQKDLVSGINEVDINTLSSGVYLIRLEGADWTAQRKFVKE